MIPFGGALCGLLVWLLFFRKRESLGLVVLFAIIGWGTHGLLDACTSYGTLVLWPFSNARIAWNNVGIIDPVPTLAWGLGSVFALRRDRAHIARWALGLGVAYLLFGVVQRERAESVQATLIAERGHTAVRTTVKPTVLQLFVWRSLYESGGQVFVDALRVAGPGGTRVYRGSSVRKFVASELPAPDGTLLARDLEQFDHFSDGWLVWHPLEKDVLGDARYALLPQDINPLWGIRVLKDQPNLHVSFESFRGSARDAFPSFWKMICGKNLGK